MKFGPLRSAPQKNSADPQPITRHSSGFEQFCTFLQTPQGLSILDMSGASQANIGFVTGLGHRISSDDAIGTMQQTFGSDFYTGQQAASNAHRFLEQMLTFPDESFDGALVWDALQFLMPPVLEEVITKLLRVMRPGAQLLLFFNAEEKVNRIPLYNYRIQDSKTLLQSPRGGFQQTQYFNNRMLERFFQNAASMKFFLTRGAQREVIVRR